MPLLCPIVKGSIRLFKGVGAVFRFFLQFHQGYNSNILGVWQQLLKYILTDKNICINDY